MNERIKLLAAHAKAYANQCTKDIDGDVSWHWMEYYTEKFAELIVKECIEVAGDSYTSTPEDCVYYVDLAVNRIAEHFGVEE